MSNNNFTYHDIACAKEVKVSRPSAIPADGDQAGSWIRQMGSSTLKTEDGFRTSARRDTLV